MALAGIATVALLAIAASSIFSGGDVNPATTAPTSTTTTTTPRDADPVEVVGYPVTDPISIPDPHFGAQVQYLEDGVAVAFRIDGGECTGGDGKLTVRGWIRNDSPVGQTLDYVIGVDFMRALTASKIAHVEAEIGPVEPGTIADWSVETVASQVVTLRCELTDVTVEPAAAG